VIDATSGPRAVRRASHLPGELQGRVWALLLVIVLFAIPLVALEVPYLGGRVNDLAALIPDPVETRIEQQLAGLEERTGAQLVVLTLPSLEGESLEEYSHRVAETWQLGRAGVDDGILFLIARDDRKMRIEIGYGLEGDLTDLQSSRILHEIVRPNFQNGDFGRGIEDAVVAMVTIVEGGEGLPPPREPGSGGGGGAPAWHVVAFFSIFTLVGTGRLGWILAPLIGFGWYAVIDGAFGSPYGFLAAGIWLIVFFLLRLLGRQLGDFGGGGSGWSSRSGSWGSGRSSGGGFSGGFSGGGGSFGGGGSSSGW